MRFEPSICSELGTSEEPLSCDMERSQHSFLSESEGGAISSADEVDERLSLEMITTLSSDILISHPQPARGPSLLRVRTDGPQSQARSNSPSPIQTVATDQYKMDFSNAAARADSFRQTINGFVWPHTDTPLTAERLSDAGLYFFPVKKCPDQVKCYVCGGKLAGFAPTDDPKVDHKTYYPNCILSKSTSGGTFGDEEIRKSVEVCAIDELPEGWAVVKASTGKVYYWNKETMESSWSKPAKIVQDAPAQTLTSSIGLLKALPKNKVTCASNSPLLF
jgi:hypothetical protein